MQLRELSPRLSACRSPSGNSVGVFSVDKALRKEIDNAILAYMATSSESMAEALPFADRPVEKAPGHWVLARAGKTVLRPGGLALSTWALKRAVLPGSDVVEFAPGLAPSRRAGQRREGPPPAIHCELPYTQV